MAYKDCVQCGRNFSYNHHGPAVCDTCVYINTNLAAEAAAAAAEESVPAEPAVVEEESGTTE
jgi:hypothetical protein